MSLPSLPRRLLCPLTHELATPQGRRLAELLRVGAHPQGTSSPVGPHSPLGGRVGPKWGKARTAVCPWARPLRWIPLGGKRAAG